MVATGLAVAAALVLLACALRLWRRLRAARAEAARLAARLARSEAALAAAPCGYVAWTADGSEHCSAGLGPAVGLESHLAAGWDSVRAQLAEADAAPLDHALAALRRDGAPFELAAATRDGLRSLQLSGARHGPLDILWLLDATPAAARSAQSGADAAALEAELARLRALLDLLPLPVWQRARDLALVYCNRAYAAAVGAASPADALFADREIAGGEGRALAERARRLGAPQSESRHVALAGARRLLELTEQPAGDGLLAGFARDVTALEAAQADLARQIDATAQILDHVRSGIAIFGPDRRLTFSNRGFAALWRLDPDWLRSGPGLGEILEALREQRRLPEAADFRAWKQERLELFRSATEPREEYLFLPDETAVRQIVAPHPLGGLIVIDEDVTGRLALERSYNELTAVVRQTVQELREGIAVYGTDGRLKLSNPAFLRHWRLAPRDVRSGLHIAEMVERSRALYRTDEPWPAFKARLVGEVMDRRAVTGRHRRTDGLVLDYATVPLPDGSVLYSENDVTDTYNVEQALRERNEALQETDRLKTQFLANVSYELRTPLTTIIGFTEILANGYFGALNERQADYCRGILAAAERLVNLTNDTLDLALVEAGQILLEYDRFEVGAMLAGVVDLARERIREKDLHVALEVAPDAGAIVADRRRIRQVLFNLVGNAVKFTPPGGRIVVSARRVAGELLIQVRDTGIGIAEEDLERVFEPFERGGSGERQATGAGLGLPLVKRFLELHGGRLDLASEPGRGTLASCWLPLDGDEAAPAVALRS